MKIVSTSPRRQWLWFEITKPGRAHDAWACSSREILGWDESGDPVFSSPRDGRLISITTLLDEAIDPDLEPGFFTKVLGTRGAPLAIRRTGHELTGDLRWRICEHLLDEHGNVKRRSAPRAGES